MPALHDVSCTFSYGQVTALAGVSGSGKSTLVALRMRFIDPERGRIVIGGRPLNEIISRGSRVFVYSSKPVTETGEPMEKTRSRVETEQETTPYGAAYQRELLMGSRVSAERVMPILVHLSTPRSIVDFGCGWGSWLAEARALGIEDVWGVDGCWVDPAMLDIPPTRFRSVDLRSPIDLGRRFDLALCLEVAEHLPAESAPVLLDTLTNHAPVVFFSAAVPGQGGQGHVNEAWPRTWREHFHIREFECFDVLRGQIWADAGIEPWYRQNSLIFASRPHLQRTPELAERLAKTIEPPLDIAHPELFAAQVQCRTHAESESVRLRQEHARLAAEHGRLGEAYTSQQIELDTLRASRSWRLTAPLRALARWVRTARIAHRGGR